MEEDQQPQQENKKQTIAITLCEECNKEAFKYKCPGCSRRTCSLTCVNSHKQRLNCSGKRDTTRFVPLSQFDDSTLTSDFNLLEDVKRVAESAQRKRVKMGGYPQFRLPFHLKALRNAAARKGTKLLLLPAGMSRRERNQTRYNQRRRSINWTIEWRFHSTDVVLLEHGIPESTTLRSVVEKHLQPSPWRNKLRRFCDENMDNLKFFMRKHHKGTKSPYRELDQNYPLSQNFAGLVILEYPVIHVYLSSDSYDFEVVKDVRPPPTRLENKETNRDGSLSPVGKHFKEEEIVEEEGAVEPHIIDLLKNSEASSHEQTSNGERPNDQPSNNIARSESEGVGTGPCTIGNEVQMLDAKIDDFDFDQELIDAYSFLMEESNPDDFLDYKQEGADNEFAQTAFLNVEELEEGEIPDT